MRTVFKKLTIDSLYFINAERCQILHNVVQKGQPRHRISIYMYRLTRTYLWPDAYVRVAQREYTRDPMRIYALPKGLEVLKKARHLFV